MDATVSRQRRLDRHGTARESSGRFAVPRTPAANPRKRSSLPGHTRAKVHPGRSTHTLAIGPDERFYVWGSGADGQLGLGHANDVRTPAQVGTSLDWLFIAANTGSSLAGMTNGTLWTWGDNFFGRLGNGTFQHSKAPIRMATASDWLSANLGYGDGSLWGWGNNSFGKVGDNTTVNRSTPVMVLPLATPPTISSIPEQVMAMNGTNQVFFTVGDTRTPASNVVVTASSSDPNLLPSAGLTIEGIGADRTLIIVPTRGQAGACRITVRATDTDKMSVVQVFALTVSGPPTIQSPHALPQARKGKPYAFQFEAVGAFPRTPGRSWTAHCRTPWLSRRRGC